MLDDNPYLTKDDVLQPYTKTIKKIQCNTSNALLSYDQGNVLCICQSLVPFMEQEIEQAYIYCEDRNINNGTSPLADSGQRIETACM